MLETLYHDVRYALRTLIRRPGFTAVVIVTLALGIGANAAIFSVVHGVLLQRLPFERPEELVMVWEHHQVRNRFRNVVSPANFLSWQEQNEVFADIAAVQAFNLTMTGHDALSRVSAGVATEGFFRMVGVSAVLGRTFLPEETVPGDESNVVMLSHHFWQNRFGGDSGVIGQTVTLGGSPQAIIGVLPEDFRVRFDFDGFTTRPPDMWAPLPVVDQWRQRTGRWPRRFRSRRGWADRTNSPHWLARR